MRTNLLNSRGEGGVRIGRYGVIELLGYFISECVEYAPQSSDDTTRIHLEKSRTESTDCAPCLNALSHFTRIDKDQRSFRAEILHRGTSSQLPHRDTI